MKYRVMHTLTSPHGCAQYVQVTDSPAELECNMHEGDILVSELVEHTDTVVLGKIDFRVVPERHYELELLEDVA